MGDRPARILYLQFANPAAYPPVAHGVRILAEAGARVWVVGTRPAGSGDIVMTPHPGIRVTLVREGGGLRQKIAYLRFLILSLWTALRTAPDWLYVSDLFGAPAGILAARFVNARTVYHEHDVHSEPSPSLLVRVCQKARARILARATCLVAPSAGRAELVAEEAKRALVHVVHNCPRREDIRPNQAPLDGPLRLVYQGTIVRQRLPMELAEALARLRGAVTLTLAGYEPAGAAGHADALIARVAALGAPGVITHVGLITERAELMDFCARGHAGLALVPMVEGDVNMRTMAGASNKVFDYLACGLPVLVPDAQDWNAMFVAPGFARAVNPHDANSLVEALSWFAQHREQARAMGAAGQRRVMERWNYESQFAPVCGLLLQQPGVIMSGLPRSAA